MSRRGKKINQVKNGAEHDRWMQKKKVGRPKQIWVWDCRAFNEGHWEKVSEQS